MRNALAILLLGGCWPLMADFGARVELTNVSGEVKIELGITAGCGLYTDVQLDDKPKGHRGPRKPISPACAGFSNRASRR